MFSGILNKLKKNVFCIWHTSVVFDTEESAQTLVSKWTTKDTSEFYYYRIPIVKYCKGCNHFYVVRVWNRCLPGRFKSIWAYKRILNNIKLKLLWRNW